MVKVFTDYEYGLINTEFNRLKDDNARLTEENTRLKSMVNDLLNGNYKSSEGDSSV